MFKYGLKVKWPIFDEEICIFVVERFMNVEFSRGEEGGDLIVIDHWKEAVSDGFRFVNRRLFI